MMLTEDMFVPIKQKYGTTATARIEEMLDPRPGSRQERLQRGARYVIPGVSSSPWRDIDEFPRIRALATKLESMHEAIRSEIHAVLERGNGIQPYSHYDLGEFRREQWSSLYLFQNGRPVEETCRLCPTTAAFMRSDLGDVLCPLQEMHFSIVGPGAHIKPHSDMGNFTLNLHFAIDIPEQCGIRVGTETRTWTEGKCLLFDDSFEHEVWNRGNGRRICLLMDVWNPALSMAEREALVALVMALKREFGEE